jgi:OOP family OmpA-OmpF porin
MQQTAFSPMDLNQKVQSGQMAQKVDTFEIINDLSISMSDAYQGGTKLTRAADTLKRMNMTIPDLKMDAGLRSFGYVEMGSMINSRLVYGLTGYTKDGLTAALGNQGRDGGLTPLDRAIDGAMDDLRAANGRLAVIILSDGEDQDDAPIQAAERMKGQYGSRVCIYTIQIGDHPAGKKVLQRIAEVGGCGFYASSDDIMTSAAMGDYVEKVFLEKASPVAVKRMEPKAPVKAEEPVQEQKSVAQASAAAEPVTITLAVEFDTGKSNIKAKYHKEIKKVADFMTQYPQATAVIEGYTDNVGKREKNMRLSQDRANSIKNYLVQKFKISSARLKAAGFGPDKPIADNATVEGRQKNRRVQAVIEATGQENADVAEKKTEKKADKKVVKKKVKKVKKVQ